MAEKRKNRTKGKGRELKSRITQIRGKAKEENLSKQASKRKAKRQDGWSRTNRDGQWDGRYEQGR